MLREIGETRGSGLIVMAALDTPARGSLARGGQGAQRGRVGAPREPGALRTRSTRRDSLRTRSARAVRAANRADLQNTCF